MILMLTQTLLLCRPLRPEFEALSVVLIHTLDPLHPAKGSVSDPPLDNVVIVSLPPLPFPSLSHFPARTLQITERLPSAPKLVPLRALFVTITIAPAW